MLKAIVVLVLLAGCARTVQENCELVCEKWVECGAIDYAEVGECERICNESADTRTCERYLDEYAGCVDGKSCEYTGCASEEVRAVNCANL